MRDTFLPFAPPLIGEEEIAEVVAALRSGWITTGPKVEQFEHEFAAFIGAPASLALNSGTAALHVALAALGVGPGDAVVTTPMAFCSSAHVIEQVGARPVLVDADPQTLNIDPAKIRETLERRGVDLNHCRPKALLPVHLYGHPCDLDAILQIAREFTLDVVEDAAHALPAKYRGRTLGSLADSSPCRILTCFSFYATKNLTTAEGGMLSGPASLVKEARLWSLHGMSRDAYQRYEQNGSWYYEVVRPGFKYNMTDIQAAIGLHQLRKLAQFQARRRRIAQLYHEAFSSLEELEVPLARNEVEHAWHLYVLRLNLDRLRISRNRFIEELKARNIGTSVHFIPIHLHPYYRDKYHYRPDDFPVASREYQRIVSLPIYPGMSDGDVESVADAVNDVIKRFRR